MKKLLSLLLVSILLLCPLLPAMAFTADDNENADNPVNINLYLVEYNDADLFGVASLPSSNRGYAKNEIIAAVAELTVPTMDILKDSSFRAMYRYFMLSGEQVDFNVAENNITIIKEDVYAALLCGNSFGTEFDTQFLNDDLLIELFNLQFSDKDETYRWLFFAKVTGENASLTATLYDGSEIPNSKFEGRLYAKGGGEIQRLERTLDDTHFWIYKIKDPDGDGLRYEVQILPREPEDVIDGFIIYVDDDYRSTGMELFKDYRDAKPTVSLGVTPSGKLGIVDPENPAVILTSGGLYDEYMDIYYDIVLGKLGLDYFRLGNFVRDSFFENLSSKNTLTKTVEIMPFTPYVTVPQSIVLNPPKTGGGADFTGFALLMLSGTALLLLKNRPRYLA